MWVLSAIKYQKYFEHFKKILSNDTDVPEIMENDSKED